MSAFGNCLSRLRQQQGWSLRRLAKALGLSPVYLCDVEHGKRSPMAAHYIASAVLAMCGGGREAKWRLATMLDIARDEVQRRAVAKWEREVSE